MEPRRYSNLAFTLTFKIFVLNVNDIMKKKVIANFMFVGLLIFPKVVKNKLCYLAIYGLKFKFFGKSELFVGLQSP